MSASADILIDIEKFERWQGAFMVPVEYLVGPDWNVNEMAPAMFNELIAEIEKHEFDSPLQIVPIPGEKLFLVVGGDHRLDAVKHLKWKSVPCCLKKSLDPQDIDALKEYSVRRNNLHGSANPDKLEALQVYLAQKLNKSGSAIRRRLLLSSQRLRSKVNNGQAQAPATAPEGVKASGKDTLEDKSSGPKNKPFVPPKKKSTDEDMKASTAHSVSLAKKHKLQADIKSLAKIMLTNCENPDALGKGFAYFGHGGRCHLVVEMENGLSAQVKALVKRMKADKDEIGKFLEEAIKEKLESLPKKKSKPKPPAKSAQGKGKAKVPSSKKGSATAAA